MVAAKALRNLGHAMASGGIAILREHTSLRVPSRLGSRKRLSNSI